VKDAPPFEKGPSVNRGLGIIKLLWARFLKQPWQYKLITFVLLIIASAWMVVFYSSFLIWQLFTFVMTKPLLWVIEWYLKKTA